MAWQSKRVKRCVDSTLAAECLAAVTAAQTAIVLRTTLADILCKADGDIPISVMCDNKSLVDAIHTSTSVEGKRLQIDINILREMMDKGEITEFRWISTKYQLANALTKSGASCDYLMSVLSQSEGYNCDTGVFG